MDACYIAYMEQETHMLQTFNQIVPILMLQYHTTNGNEFIDKLLGSMTYCGTAGYWTSVAFNLDIGCKNQIFRSTQVKEKRKDHRMQFIF